MAEVNRGRARHMIERVLSYRVSRVLIGISAVLTLLSALLNGLVEWRGRADRRLVELERLFDVVQEGTVQSWFSSVLLAAAAVLAAVVAARFRAGGNQWWGRWVLISGALAWVSLDEAVSIHELVNDPEAPSGLMRYRWVVLAVPLVAALAVWALPALRAVAPPIRRLLIASGVIYVGGAVVVEWITGFFHGTNLIWGGLSHLEELLEMSGVVLFIEALLRLNHVPRDEGGRLILAERPDQEWREEGT